MDRLRAEVGARLCRAAGVAILAALAASACVSEARAPLSDTFPSPEAAAGAVLDSLARSDRERLLDLALDQHEFRRIIWPELPSSRPEVGLPWDYAWNQLSLHSRAGLAMTFAAHEGRRYRLEAVRFRGETTRHASYVVHRDSELIVEDAAGARRTLRLFGSMIEQGGRWKIFSYAVD